MKKLWLSAVCAAVLMTGAAQAMAQEDMLPPPLPEHEMSHPGTEPGWHGPKFDERRHERAAKLADDLGLTAEQRAQADKIRQDGRDKMEPLIQQMDELRQKMNQVRKDNMADFEKILTPEQKAKMDQIIDSHHPQARKRHMRRSHE